MLKKVHKFRIDLTLLSGMHITGAENTFDIGGADSQVIKNPLTDEPYIPGSSLKGKIRSLLEYKYGTPKNAPGAAYGSSYAFQDESVKNCALLFEPSTSVTPNITRGIFRDLVLTDESKKELSRILGDGIYTEIKAENKIHRLKGKAETPRFIERVPAGSRFEGEIDIIEFDGDPYEQVLKYLQEAIELLNQNFIGGSGSRGYGQVFVTMTEIDE